MIEIKLNAEPAQVFRITLDNVNTNFRVYWVENHYLIGDELDPRGYYYCDIDNVHMKIDGIKLVTDRDLLEPFAYNEFGGLVMIDTKGERLDCRFEELGDRFALMYIEKIEVEEVRENLDRII